MQRFRKIVVGLDLEAGRDVLTPGSSTAGEQALWLAQRTGARVDFLHSTWVDPEEDDSTAAGRPADVEEQVGALRAKYGVADDAARLILDEERPWRALIGRVLAGEADLVVVAKRSHTRRDDRKLGSVSLKLVRQCPAPVWVVKPEHEMRHRYVLAATDLTAVGDLATEYAAFIAQAEECDLGVVHAWQLPIDLQLSAARLGEQETARRKQAIADAARQHVRALPRVEELGERAHVFVACDSPSHLILRLADEKDPDLVVMGTVSRGGIAGLLVGNTAEKLLYRLDCSLLTVKPKDFICPLAPEGASAG